MPWPLERFSKAVPSDTPFLEERGNQYQEECDCPPAGYQIALSPYRDQETGQSRKVPEAGLVARLGDSQAEGESTSVQVNQAAHDVTCCPRLPSNKAFRSRDTAVPTLHSQQHFQNYPGDTGHHLTQSLSLLCCLQFCPVAPHKLWGWMGVVIHRSVALTLP